MIVNINQDLVLKVRTKIEFINHASVLIKDDNISLLSDPWYEGDVFHKGWNLLYENKSEKICELISRITHIWISHEHPDHFSVFFFKKYADLIIKKNIVILFQKNKDQRVKSFLKKFGFQVLELKYNEKFYLSEKFSVTCFKDGFYDSALLVENGFEKILNLNDCQITNYKKAKDIFNKTGVVDVLLTQFSYASWKGGSKNTKWRIEAARKKIETIKLQISVFEPKFMIPFASFIYFSNNLNFYMNDLVNSTEKIYQELKSFGPDISIMKPYDILNSTEYSIESSINFWEKRLDQIKEKKLNEYRTIYFEELKNEFYKFRERIISNNSLILMRFFRKIKVFRAFESLSIYLIDLKLCIEMDYIKNIFRISNEDPLLNMHSESLYFIFKNSFGYETLTVNGCFEENKKNGFSIATKTFAVDNLNNLGISFSIKIITKINLLLYFAWNLYKSKRKLYSN